VFVETKLLLLLLLFFKFYFIFLYIYSIEYYYYYYCTKTNYGSRCSTGTLVSVLPYSKQFVATMHMCSFKLKMYQDCFQPGLRPGPRWGSLRL